MSPFVGVTVLGEPLNLLWSGMSRLRAGDIEDGLVEFSGVLWNEEIGALKRAQARTERDILGDRRSTSQRDVDQFAVMSERVLEAVEAFNHGRALASFRADLPYRDRGRLG